MNTGMAYIFAILFIVLALNLYFIMKRIRGIKSSYKKRSRRIHPDEAKQAVWRDKEVVRRIEREQSDSYERVTLRNETLAYYEIIRQRYAKKEALERLGIDTEDNLDELQSLGLDDYLSEDVKDISDNT